MGGSFNPAHDGHLHVSRLALDRLGLDHIWWLVSPQNPLKPVVGMAPRDQRLADARRLVANQRRIRVSDLEAAFGTSYTVDTLAEIKTCFPEVRFVLIIGADLLSQLPRWRNWHRLFEMVPIAVFDRAPYSLRVLGGTAAHAFASSRLEEAAARLLADQPPPAWVYLHTQRHPASATAIRARAAGRGNNREGRTEKDA